jgi:DNA-binding SARP family transcriptional activator/TolB-like protein
MPPFSLRLLGDPVLLGPGGPVTGRASYRRRLALLSILAVARGRPVGRERIIGLLWAEYPSDAARHTLSEALYVLRKELGDALFTSVGDEVALNPEVMASDVDEFRAAVEACRLEDAVRAYRGPLLDGFYVSDAPEFEEWVEGERDRLARAYAQALEGLALAAEGGGEWTRAAEWWRRLAAHDRYSSRVAMRLVRALEAAGDRMAALRFAGAHAVLLREELGGEPDRELAALVERLRAEPLHVPTPPPPEPERGTADSPGDAAVPLAAGAGEEPVRATEPEESGGVVEADEEIVHPAPRPVTTGTEAEGDGAGRRLADGLPGAPAAPSSPRPAVRRWTSRRILPALAAAGAMAAALAFAVLPRGAPDAPRYDPRRIAVLYLDDYSENGELAYLANGLTEMLIHELSQVQALDVVSRHGVKRYRERAVPFDSLAADLRAGSVVEGSVQRSGDSVRVTVQLIDANSQVHLESRSLVHPLGPGSLFALQDAVAGEVTAFLRRRVGREIRLSDLRRQAGTPQALELVLRAGQAREDAAQLARSAHERDVRSALRVLGTADSLLALAERQDREWTEPVLLRGWVAMERSRLLRGPPQMAALVEARGRAEAVLRRRAASLDASELRGNVLLRMVIDAPHEARGRPWLADAERDLRGVVAADPGRAAAWSTLSQLLRLGGDLAEAELAARRGREEDAYLEVPDEGADRMYRVAFALGDYPRARHWCGEGRRQFPGDYRFHECALVLLARDPAARPLPDSAWRLLAAADRVDPPAAAVAAARPYSPVFRRMMVAAVLARAGLGDSARSVSARARRQVGGDAELRLSFLWDDAYLAAVLGERVRSAALLDSFVAGRPTLREYVAREPAFRGVWRP